MESNTPKRRKLDHTNGGPSFESTNPSASSMGSSGASAFVLETEELLREVKLDYNKAFPGVDETLRQFKDSIESLEPHEPLLIGDVSADFEKANRIIIPYPDPKPAQNSPYKLSFERPAQVNVVGSYTLKTMVKSQTDLAVDMIVVMPTSLFQEKDYLNMRYFYKRAYYLAYIAAGLRKAYGSAMEFSFDHLHDNTLLPILIARPKGAPNKESSSQKAAHAIRIIPNAPEGCFPATKLTAVSNAVRQGKAEDSKTARRPTPFYNTTLKAESQFSAYLRLLHKASNACAAFKDACILGRIWLQQRGFGGRIRDGGFGHFEWAILMALLLQGGGRKGEAVLSPSLHSTQLFKATLQFLVSANLQKKLTVIGKDPPELETVRQPTPILYDVARGLNVLFKMTPWSIAMLTEQAKWSLSAMNSSPLDQFEPTFIIKADQPLQIFDLLARIHLPTSKEGFDSPDRRGFLWDFSEKLYQTLRRALGERVQLVQIEGPKTKASWPISATSPKAKQNTVLVGIIVDPVKASQGREYGPSYEQKKECEKFREFWGEKADLWQFPDGNIVESLDWTSFSYLGFSGICEAIIGYILKLRLQVADADIEFCGREATNIMTLAPSDKLAFDGARQAFEILERDIRDLEDLPLHVKHVAPIDAGLRRTSLHVPDFNVRKPLMHPMEVVVSFEVSGKWPENLAAIQRAKIAFLLKIGSSLEEAKDEIQTHLGLEDANRDDVNLAFLDIVYENGVAFRLRVHSDLEEALLDRLTKDQTVERHVRTDAADLFAMYKRMYTNMPLHNQTISTFCTRFPALSPSIRLTKRWFDAHKLSCHFNEELIELFTLQAFLKPYPWQTPTSATTGFLRTLLLLSRWDWRDEALVVDPADALSTSQRLEIGTRLEAWRKIDPGMHRTVLFVATPHDVSGVAYTQRGPARVVATRMTSLARSACKAVRERGLELDARSLFQTSLGDYDILIHLSPKALRGVSSSSSSAHELQRYKNLDLHTSGSNGKKKAAAAAPPPLEPPARTLLKRLAAVFASPLLFFHGGGHGEDDAVIGALWNPLLHDRAFTVNMPCSLKTAEGGRGGGGSGGGSGGSGGGNGELFEVNRNAILAEIARIGGDAVVRVEVKGEGA
ncbi:Nrap protein [Whalleya microplaca]|nr:Nrap protein [Whalleya microplaca]